MTTQANPIYYSGKKTTSFSNAFSEHSYLLLTLALVFGMAVTIVLLFTRLLSLLFAGEKIEENFE